MDNQGYVMLVFIHNIHFRICSILCLILWIALLPVYGSQSEQDKRQNGYIQGRVTETLTGDPIGDVYIVLDGTGHFVATDESGKYLFSEIPARRYLTKVYRLGYGETEREVNVPPGDTVRVDFSLEQIHLSFGEVRITGRRGEDPKSGAVEMEMSGKNLQRHLGVTIAETIDEEPGIAQRTMGPAPARPVLRGLGGDRVKILEDGSETGDLSASSADHAVAVEPMTTNRVEVIRGPATLMYTPNALGGVVNVVRGNLSPEKANDLSGNSHIQGESVNSGYAGGADVTLPLGPLNIQMDGSTRNAGNIMTPEGELRNTGITTRNVSAGVSGFWGAGYAGISGSYYNSLYGIPGGFVGAHPNGVSIDLNRRQLQSKGRYQPGVFWLDYLEWQGGYTVYQHQEYESNGVIGVEFGVVTWTGRVTLLTRSMGKFGQGAFGVSGSRRDYAAGGFAFTPSSAEQSYSLFAYQETEMKEIRLKGAIRGGFRRITPDSDQYSERIGSIRERRFSNLALSFSGRYSLASTLEAGVMLMRSYRPPTLEELYTEGPHLAAYSFEVGNPNLHSETGRGAELFLEYHTDFGHIKGTLFRSDFSGYIFPRNTGNMNYRTLLPIYQYTGMDAFFFGAELEGHTSLGEHWSGRIAGSYVRAGLKTDNSPLPRIPPLRGKLELQYSRDRITLGGTVRGAAPQTRVDRFEEPTDGYVVFDLLGQYMIPTGNLIHGITLSVENLSDAVYRKHLSRVKEIMPEAGRNIRLNYKVYF